MALDPTDHTIYVRSFDEISFFFKYFEVPQKQYPQADVIPVLAVIQFLNLSISTPLNIFTDFRLQPEIISGKLPSPFPPPFLMMLFWSSAEHFPSARF